MYALGSVRSRSLGHSTLKDRSKIEAESQKTVTQRIDIIRKLYAKKEKFSKNRPAASPVAL